MKILNSHHYSAQTKLVLLTIFGIVAYFALNQIAHASYKAMFTISAYYSPLPGQERYVTGSYEGDIRLNGSGVNSADGTPVYPGMIAAPSSYPFGTKMNIPGVGMVAVHDRGGAIVHAGERGQSYDRLDIWMGYGDKGLSRALNWGKRNVEVTVYGIDPGLKENVYLEGFTEAEKFIRNIVTEQKIFKDDLWYGQSGDKVKELQQYLTDLGYYKGKQDGFYGDSVYKAVMQFQIDAGIVENEEEFGAGYFGVKTRREIEAALLKKKKNKLPDYNLGKDDSGEEVKKLQKALKDLGYDVEINGIYDEKTVNAVFEFQTDNDILIDEDDLGAGYFGPLTYQVLSDKMVALSEPEEESLQTEAIVQADFEAFEASLQIGDSGEEVKRLQEELRKMNLIRIQPTGFYGKVTENAVFKFQQRKGLLTSRADHGAGVFGPMTRNALNSVLGYRANTKQLIASKTAEYNKNNQNTYIAQNEPEEQKEDLKLFISDLVYGSKNPDVETLQEKLKDLGYFKGAIVTDYYGDVTKDAVIAFQLDKGIIASELEAGAGRLGPETREMLNAIL
jgi:peptidoglycan hydrolase-like protein with peptidoglycan-binding domain/3D (Asp-Asp-Asp) domain-containing protein